MLRAVRRAAGRQAAVLVGGSVRDVLLGRASRDLDVAVPRGALDIGRRVADGLGGAFVPLDVTRGVARVLTLGLRLDLTDFRAPSLTADLAGRDYTVNALAVPLADLLREGRAPIADPTGGLGDLAARRLRPVATDALASDPVRTLRGARLEAALGFRLTPAAVRAIQSSAPSLRTVSAERVRDELLALLGQPTAGRALRRTDALGLLEVVLPEIGAMRRTAQPAPHRFPVLEHSLRAVEALDYLLVHLDVLKPFTAALAVHVAQALGGGVERRHVLKLAGLLHDVAKPETIRSVGGATRFFGHDVRGAERARAIGERLRLPDRAVELLERLVRHHLRPMHLAAAGELTPRARYRFFRDLRDDAQDLLLLVLADAAAVRGESPRAVWQHAGVVRELLAGWQEERDAAVVPPWVRGGDVMRQFGLSPGPEVGRLLAAAREAQAIGQVRSREEALAYLDSLRQGLIE